MIGTAMQILQILAFLALLARWAGCDRADPPLHKSDPNFFQTYITVVSTLP